jgi:hypothetical protein
MAQRSMQTFAAIAPALRDVDAMGANLNIGSLSYMAGSLTFPPDSRSSCSIMQL